MTRTEQLLTDTLQRYAETTEVAGDGLERIAAKRRGAGVRWRRYALAAGVTVGALAVTIGAMVLLRPATPGPDRPDVANQPGAAGPLDRWQRVELPGMGEHDCGARLDASCVRLVDAAPLGRGGFVVVGNLGVSPVAYATGDGRTWSSVRLPVPAGRQGQLHASVEAIATDGERFVAVGMGYPLGTDHPLARTGIAWHSSDGVTWDLAEQGPLGEGAGLTDVARNGAGFVATGLVGGGRADVVDLGLFASETGDAWGFEGFLGGPLPAVGGLPAVGVEAGASTLVYAEIADGDGDADRGCGDRGVAVWLGDKDGFSMTVNGDDPRRPAIQRASGGLEDAVLRPCGNVEVAAGPAGGAGVTAVQGTTVAPLRPGVTWDAGGPTLYLYADTPPPAQGGPGAMVRAAVEQRTFRVAGEVWTSEPFAPEQHLEVVGAGAATDGYRLGVVAVDGTVTSDDGQHRVTHLPGDGAGTNLGLVVDEGDGWSHAAPADAAERQRLGYETFTAGPCTGEGGWGHGAVGARALAVSGNHVLIVGRATDCLHRSDGASSTGEPFVPAIWVGPLP